LDEIGRAQRRGVSDRGAPRLAAPLCALDVVGRHQPPDTIAADVLAGAAQRLPHAPVAVGAVVGLVQLRDAGEQPLVLDAPG
jgi:hypothetical protein